MACPHLSKATGECLLQQDKNVQEEVDDVIVIEPIRHEWCLSDDKRYRQCPVFQEFLYELVA